MAKEKFRLEPEEIVIRKGPIERHIGETGVMNSLTGKFKLEPSTAVLTNRRLVGRWRMKLQPPLGPLIYLIMWLGNRNDVHFSIPHETLAGIQEGPGQLITLRTAVGAAYPAKRAQRRDKAVEFVEA